MLITDKYQEVLRQTRRESGAWGTTGGKYADDVRALLQLEPYTDILDYGAGHGALAAELTEFEVTEYDPAILGKEHGNQPRSFVTCFDVLEHIEPDLLEAVLLDLKRCLLDKGYFIVSCRKAKKVLADGRNAHLIVETPRWWSKQIKRHFDVIAEAWDVQNDLYKSYVRTKDLASKD